MAERITAGMQAAKGSGGNVFGAILQGVLSAKQRRLEEDKVREKEDREFIQSLDKLRLQSDLEGKLAKEKFEREGNQLTPSQELNKRKLDLQDRLKKVVAGEGSFEELKAEFPLETERIGQVEDENTPVEGSFENISTTKGGLKDMFGILGVLSNLNKVEPKTKNFISQIKTEADLQEFIDFEDEVKKSGVNVEQVRQFFGI